MSNKKQIEEITFGDTIKDELTGFQGVVYSQTTSLTGCKRWNIVVIDKDGKDTYHMVQLPKLIKKGNLQTNLLPFKFEIGTCVKDKITDKEFIITSMSQHITGFNRYYCRSVKPMDFTDLNSNVTFEENELDYGKASKSLIQKIAKSKEDIETGKINPSPSLTNKAIRKN